MKYLCPRFRPVMMALLVGFILAGISSTGYLQDDDDEEELIVPQRSPYTLANLPEGVDLIAGVTVDDLLLASADQNCTISKFRFTGQNYYISGGSGGLSMTDPMLVDEDVGGLMNISGASPENPVQSGADIQAAAPGGLQTPVAVLIVDDFSSARNITTILYQLNHGQITPVQAQAQLEEVSHGSVVAHHTARLFAGAATLTHIWLETVDTQNYDTGTIADNIRQTIFALGQGPGIRRFVVNMSFAVVPCGTAKDFAASGATSFEMYINDVVAKNPGIPVLREELASILTNPLDEASDPLLLLLNQRCLSPNNASEDIPMSEYMEPNNPELQFTVPSLEYLLSGEAEEQIEAVQKQFMDAVMTLHCTGDFAEVVYVAASGNFGWGYPFLPAAWDFVISVGGDITGLPGTHWEYSNLPHVTRPVPPEINVTRVGFYRPGAWFTFDHQVYYAGTSFAAPIMSVEKALELAQQP